jgi:hypothetical protein
MTLPTTPKLAIGLAVLPLAISTGYLVYLNRLVRRECTISTGIRNKRKHVDTIPPNVCYPLNLPQEVADAKDQEWVLAYERVVLSRPLHPAVLAKANDDDSKPDISAVLRRYLRGTMTAFSWTPQAFLLRASLPRDAKSVRQTFNTDYIQSLDFLPGDRVNGFWKVMSIVPALLAPGLKQHRAEMALDAPPGYTGPVVEGVIVAGMETVGDGGVLFFNETWMWRKQGERPVLLERHVGRWLHEVLAGWLVMNGVEEVRKE